MQLVVFGSDGRPARHVRVTRALLVLVALAAAGALASAVWVGWQVGELTALL